MTAEKLCVEIHLGNAAFEDTPGTETARILRRLATQLERGEREWGLVESLWMALYDVNGSKVGHAELLSGPREEQTDAT